MKYDIDKLRELVRFMNENGLVEIEVADDDNHVRLRRPEIMQYGIEEEIEEKAAAPAGPKAEPEKQANPGPEILEFTSPMVGTFRRAASEGEPFVDVGNAVKPKSVLCVIEAMSVPNEIQAEVSGTVTEALAKDGMQVEFGTPLFRITLAPESGKQA